MAVLPLNTFRTITRSLTTDAQTLYTCPTGVTSIVLLAQVSNTSDAPAVTANVTFSHVRQRTTTELVKNCPIPAEDARSVLTGRLVLEEGDRITVTSSVVNALKIVMSVVESANT